MAKILPDDVDASLSFLEANPRAAKPLDKIPAAPIIRKDITQQKTGIPDDVEASLARLEGKPVPTFAQPTERGLTQREIEADVLGLAIRKGIKSDTALAAHRRDVAAKTGVNPGLVTSQVEDTAFYKEHDPEDLIKNFPAVAKYLGVQGNAELVGKDIGHLKTLETFFRRAVQDPEIVAAKGVVALAQSAVGIVDLNPFFLGALGKKLEEKGIDFPKISKTLTELYTPEMQAALGEVQNAKGFWGTLQAAAQNPSAVGEMVGVSLPSMYLGSIYARAMMPLLPAAAAIPIGEGLTMAGSAAEQIRTQSPDKELDAKGAWLSWGTGLVGTAVGAFGMKFSQRIGIEDPDVLLATGKLSDVVIGKLQQSKVPLSLATRLSAGFVSEGIVEELPQGVTEQIFQNIALGKQWDEGVPEAAALSIVTGGAMGAAVQAGVTTGRQGTAKDDPLHKATDAHLNDIGKAVSAEEQQAALQKWSEEIVNNKLRKESPSAFKEFVKTMADEHSGIKEVFIDAKHLEESLQQSGIKPEEFVKNMPEVARDLQTALATSGEVRIPIEDYATYLAGSKLEPMILNQLRTDPEGMTYSESQTFFQQQKEIFAEKAKEIITSSQQVLTREEFATKPQNDGKDYTEYLKAHENKVEAFARDAQEVHDKILGGMNAAKRFNRAVNAVYAVPFREFYTVNAAKEGILPSELYTRLPLNFSKMQIEDGGLEQAPIKTVKESNSFNPTVATPDSFTKENVANLINSKNWTVLTAENPNGVTQDAAVNAEANARLRAELDSLGLKYEVVFGMYPGDAVEAESYIVYDIRQKQAHEIGNKYGQDSVLTREGLVYHDGTVTPPMGVITFDQVEQASKTGYTRVPRTGAIFTFDLDWSKEKAAKQGGMTVLGRRYAHEKRAVFEGARAGKGLPGAENDRVKESDDPRLKTRVAFYVDTGKGIKPEAGLGAVEHDVVLSNIYDASTNPLGFRYPSDRLGGNVFEQQVLDAGYDGYYSKFGDQGAVVVLGDAAKSIRTDNGQGRDEGIPRGQTGQNTSVREADGSLQGLPRKVGEFNAKHYQKAEEITRKYMVEAGLPYNPPSTYAKVNPERAKRVADAFDQMQHDPQNPEVKAAYGALVKETTAQYKAVIDSGLVVEFIDFNKTGDPYEGNPRKMTEDVINNNHMWVFSTREGFGSDVDFNPQDNPLLAETDFEISGQKALANDLFRVVHDYFGHVKEGVGFRAEGEENAWRAHMSMFSPLAGRALTTETRGQNSWVNFGPFAESNKTASAADTHYADQKIGLLPEWVSTEGAKDEVLNQSAFYSSLEREIPNLRKVAGKDGNIKPEQAKAWIEARQKEGKFKKEEIEAVGLMDWLDTQEGKVPVADIENFVRENGVRIDETLLSPENTIDEDQVFDTAYESFAEDNPQGDMSEEEYQDAWESEMDFYMTSARENLSNTLSGGETKFDQYVLPGGENYRELLLTLPAKKFAASQEVRKLDSGRWGLFSGGERIQSFKTEEEARAAIIPQAITSDVRFRSAHFDQPNILAHVRVNERTVTEPLTPEEAEALKQNAVLNVEIQKLWSEQGEVAREITKELKPIREEISNRLREEALASNDSAKLAQVPFATEDEMQARPPTANQERLAQLMSEGDSLRKQQVKIVNHRKKVLFVEEIQSDWAQQGRDKGFSVQNSQERDELNALDEKAEGLRNRRDALPLEGEEVQKEREAINLELFLTNNRRGELWTKVKGSTPFGPFVQNTKSWTALAVKRLMRYAAENGFDNIAWTTGEQQAARYDLSKQIAAVNYVHYPESDSYGLHFETIGSDRGIADRTVKSGELSDFVGKELAEKIVKGEGSARKTELDNGDVITTKRLSGLDLKIGGEGMKAFYDQIVPQVVNDVSKKLGGGKVGTTAITPQAKAVAMPHGWVMQDANGKQVAGPAASQSAVEELYRKEGMAEQHSLDITPEMRDKIMQGLPLFQGNRAGFNPNTFTMTLLDGSDLSSVIHEGGHFYLEALNEMATRPEAPQQIKDDFRKTLEWFGITGNEVGMPGGETLAQSPLNENFKKWFGDSKVVDKEGEPLVVYRGESGGEHYNEFDRNRTTAGVGFFFAEDIEQAEGYARGGTETRGFLLSADKVLDLTDPYSRRNREFMKEYADAFDEWVDRYSGEETHPASMLEAGSLYDYEGTGSGTRWNALFRLAEDMGYDGVKVIDATDGVAAAPVWVVFKPEQIKSATGNKGTFDPNDPNILNQGGETPQPGQLPPGRTPEEIWNSMTLDQKRPYHEQWAQSWERYALEGKAPTLEMQPVFARFRAWILSVYKLTKELLLSKQMEKFLRSNPLAEKLNDDVRAVFDRLIASDEAISEAQKARSYAPLFATSEEAGVTDKQFQEYVDEGRRSANEATSELDARSIRDMKWLTGARTRALKSLQAEARTKRKMMRTEVEQDIAQEPVERAKSYFAKGEYTNDNGEVIEAEVKAKLNKAEVRELLPNIDMQKLRGMTSDDGIALDLAAQLTGFGSGEALLKALNDSEPTRDKVAAEVDKRMLEQYGDLVDDAALSAAADEAVHNEARARFMATGLKMLLKTSATSSQLVKAAKQAAEQAIAGKAIRDIRPGQYARAETKANREALKRAPKDRAGAAEAQRAALLNNKLYSVARDAKNEVDSILKYVRKFDNRKLGKVIHHDYLEQIVDLLSPFDFKNLPLRQIDKNKSLAAWIEEQEANGFQPAIDVDTIEKSKLKNYKDMTLEELRGLKDTIKQIEHLGRYKDKLLTAKDRREFNERMLEAEDSIRENANRTVEERATPTDTLGKMGQWFRQMSAGHRKFSSIIREMDGGRDNGTMWNLLSRAMNEAGDMETEMRQQAAEKVASLFKMIELDQGFMNLSAKKRLVPGTDISMTHEQRIMFAMNWGNEGNRQRLLDGGITGRRALSMPQAQSILDTLTKPEWDFVQATWDYVGTYKEQIAALERKMTGVEPLWIEPASIETKFGNYAGGYFPAKYDAELSTRSESLEAVTDLRMGMKGAFGAAATRNGYTQERSKQVIGRPLLLSFNVIPQHVNEVIHRLSWQPWLTDANRVLRHLDSPVREHYGTEILREMRDTVMDIATGDAPAKNATEAAINRLRMGSTIVGMGWRVTTALLQPSGLAQSYVRVGPKWVSQGILQFLTSPNDSAEFADSRSTFMKNRGTTMNREINEVLNTLRTGEGVSNLTASYFWLIAKMQRTVDIPTWIGAYNKGLAEVGYENAADDAQRKTMEDHAVRLADQAVIDSQSSGMTKDLARVQRGSPLNKILTNFYSYFSATYNLNIEAVRKTNFMKPAEVMLMANNLIVLNVIPVLFAVALKESIKGNCGDDLECLAGKLANEQISYMLGQMILLREIGAAVGVATGGDQYGYQGPAGLRFFGDLYKAGVQVNQGEADMPMFKSLNNVAGAVLHYPAGQINNTVEGIIAVENGDVEGASILPALLFGPPKD